MKRTYGFSDIAMIVYFSSQPLLSLLVRTTSLPVGKSILGLTLMSIFLMGIYENIKEKRIWGIRQFFIRLLLIITIITLTYLYKPSIRPWILDSNWGVFQRVLNPADGIFAMLAIILVANPNKIVSNLQIPVLLNFLYRMYDYWNYLRQGAWVITANDGISTVRSNYSMGFGYAMCFIFVISFIIYFVYSKKIYLLIASISSILAVLYGSRGALLVASLFFILIVLAQENKKNQFLWGNILLIGLNSLLMFIFSNVSTFWLVFMIAYVLIVSLLLLYIFINNKEKSLEIFSFILALNIAFFIVILLVLFFIISIDQIEFSSRTLNNLFTGQILEENGRDIIWNLSQNEITKIFPFGNGFFGDRPIVGKQFRWGYSHQLFLEIIVSFGLLGIFYLLGLIWKIHKSYYYSRNNLPYRLLLVGFIALCFQLMISNSFWYSTEYWSLIGLILVINKDRMKYYEK